MKEAETIRIQLNCVSANRQLLRRTLSAMLKKLSAQEGDGKTRFLRALNEGPYKERLHRFKMCEKYLTEEKLLQAEEVSIRTPLPGASVRIVRLQADAQTLPLLTETLSAMNASLCGALAALWTQYCLFTKGNQQ